MVTAVSRLGQLLIESHRGDNASATLSRSGRVSKMRAWKMVCAAIALVTLAAPEPLSAQAYPAKPIRIVVTSFGTGPDILARLIGNKFTEAWGQQVVIDARAGASGRIAAEHVARSPADGYTLMVVTSQFAISSALYEKLAYDPLKDFSAVALMASSPFILVVHPSLPARSVSELIALAKLRPRQVQSGTSGAGSPTALALQRLNSMAGIDILAVPFKAIGQAITDTIAGHINVTFGVIPTVLPLLRQGRLRGLGVTSLRPTLLAPDLPPIAQILPGYEVIGWYGLVAPAHTADDIISKLNSQVINALQTSEIQQRLASMGADPARPSTSQEFASYLAAQIEEMRQLIKESGARPE